MTLITAPWSLQELEKQAPESSPACYLLKPSLCSTSFMVPQEHHCLFLPVYGCYTTSTNLLQTGGGFVPENITNVTASLRAWVTIAPLAQPMTLSCLRQLVLQAVGTVSPCSGEYIEQCLIYTHINQFWVQKWTTWAFYHRPNVGGLLRVGSKTKLTIQKTTGATPEFLP